jgi:diadenosine tetraphosphate (Ap4A) HIT family hydrolase
VSPKLFTLPAAAANSNVPIVVPDVDCVFCERLSGDRVDWAIIDEDELSVSFINPRQFEVGQALVIPRRHAPTLLDMTADEAAAVIHHAQRLAAAMVAAFDPDGITLWQNNGVVSLQEVPHAHLHVVPRRYGSGYGEGPSHLAALSRAERAQRLEGVLSTGAPLEAMQELADQIRAKL